MYFIFLEKKDFKHIFQYCFIYYIAAMNTFFYHFAQIANFIPLQHLARITGQGCILPFYHLVSDEEVIHIKNLYRVKSVEEFEDDLDFFLKNYEPVDFHEFISDKKVKKNRFLLSFDDGLREFYDVVAPILKRKGVPAICFLNSGFIDNKELFFKYKASILIENLKTSKFSSAKEKELKNWFQTKGLAYNNHFQSLLSVNYQNKGILDELATLLDVCFPEYLLQQKPYLETGQIKELIAQGFHFGAHSIDHPFYAKISEEEQFRQTKQSIDEITSLFKLDYRLFSFPFSDYGVSKSFFEKIFDAVHPVADITFGTAGIKKDTCFYNKQRIPVENGNYTAKEIIYAEYLYYICKAFLGKNVIKR